MIESKLSITFNLIAILEASDFSPSSIVSITGSILLNQSINESPLYHSGISFVLIRPMPLKAEIGIK